jgi:hypothetical protein
MIASYVIYHLDTGSFVLMKYSFEAWRGLRAFFCDGFSQSTLFSGTPALGRLKSRHLTTSRLICTTLEKF